MVLDFGGGSNIFTQSSKLGQGSSWDLVGEHSPTVLLSNPASFGADAIPHSTNAYYSVIDTKKWTTTPENHFVLIPREGTLKNLGIQIFGNNLNGATTINVTRGGPEKLIIITVAAGTTGVFFSDVEADIKKGDYVYIDLDTTASNAGEIQVIPTGMEFY